MIDDPTKFPKGTRFVFGGKEGRIVDCMVADNAQMRKIVYDDGVEEVVTLQTLIKDSKCPGFNLLDEKDEDN